MKKYIFNYTKDRKWYVNLLICIFFVTGILFIPTIFAVLINDVIKNKYVCSLLGNLLFACIMIVVYHKDLSKEFKIYTDNFYKNIKPMFKYYFSGLGLMILFNIILFFILGEISQNETQVRDILVNHTLYMFFSITFVAPLVEELVFRKSVSTVINNKWLYAIISGILFGGAHIMTNVTSGTFIISDLLYILPYGSFGFTFALLNYETKTTFNSITVHAIHNLINGIILMNMHFLGVF